MSFGFAELQEVLSKWPQLQVPQETASDSLMERIRQVLSSFAPGGRLQKVDLQPLLRHLLLRESITSGHENLRVPANADWPTFNDWASHGVSAMSVGSDAFLLTGSLKMT